MANASGGGAAVVVGAPSNDTSGDAGSAYVLARISPGDSGAACVVTDELDAGSVGLSGV